MPQDERADRLLIHFGAVDYRACIWLNGERVAIHEGGHTPFTADITACLLPDDEEQVVVARAEDLPTDLTQHRGKQYWEEEPRVIWYHRTTGIWQPVWLEPVPHVFIEDVRWTPDVDRGLVGLEVRLNVQPANPLRVRLRLSLEDDVLVEDSYLAQRTDTRRQVGLEPAVTKIGRRQLLWAPSHPNLLDAESCWRTSPGRCSIPSAATWASEPARSPTGSSS